MDKNVKTENDLKKEYLRQYRRHVQRINRIESDLEEIRSMKCYPSVNNDGMPHGSSNSDLSSYAALIDAKERELVKEKQMRTKQYAKINDCIDLMENEAEKDLLHYRYIKGMSWWEVAEKLECSEREVYRKHGKALIHLNLT